MQTYRNWLLAGCLTLFSMAAQAGPVNVTYSVSGTTGNWILNFTVSNGLPSGSDQAIYLFGVKLSAPDVIGSPTSYDPTVYTTWTNSGLGGSDLLYNNVWVDATASNLLPGNGLAGFKVLDKDTAAPTSVQWFALLTGTVPYSGAGSFTGDPYNPGFAGVAAPEPGTCLLGLLGGIGCWFWKRPNFAVFR